MVGHSVVMERRRREGSCIVFNVCLVLNDCVVQRESNGSVGMTWRCYCVRVRLR